MRPKTNNLAPVVILAASAVVGCVPANQTIEIVDGQTRAGNSELASERGLTRDLLQSRETLESELATLRSQKNSLQATDPIGNKDEINRLTREIASMERHLRMQL